MSPHRTLGTSLHLVLLPLRGSPCSLQSNGVVPTGVFYQEGHPGLSPGLVDVPLAACLSAPKYPGAAHERIRSPFARAVSPIWASDMAFLQSRT